MNSLHLKLLLDQQEVFV